MNCIELDNNNGYKFLINSPNLRCWNERHTIWVLAVSIPGLILWGFTIPALILKTLVYYKKYISQVLTLMEIKSSEKVTVGERLNRHKISSQNINSNRNVSDTHNRKLLETKSQESLSAKISVISQQKSKINIHNVKINTPISYQPNIVKNIKDLNFTEDQKYLLADPNSQKENQNGFKLGIFL